MSDVAPEYVRYLEQRAPADLPAKALDPGMTAQPLVIPGKDLTALVSVAAKRSVGLFRPTRRTEVVWVNGDSQLAVGLVGLAVTTDDGLLTINLPVRTDQTGPSRVSVTFATGSQRQPAGLYVAAQPRPQGPALIVEAWGEHLVAYAWQCLLGLIAGLAGATGKDTRGNVLVPAEMLAGREGLTIVPMGRHRFAGSSGLTTVARGPQ